MDMDPAEDRADHSLAT
jgi:hypothetical protein